jgi:hypothetical protein
MQMNRIPVNIGVVGYCPPTKFDSKLAASALSEAYDALETTYPSNDIVIVSGLTNVGVLKLAYEEATRRGWRTIGVACKRAMEHELYPVDEKFIVGENWGDESATFTGMLEGIIRIGTGKQSLAEAAVIRDRGLPTWEYDIPTL